MHLTEKLKNKTSLQIRKLKFIFGSLILLASLITGSIALAEYGHYTSGQPVTLGEFVYDDNFQATTTPCVLTVYDPSGTLSASATTTARADGWHYYTLTTSTDVGLWSASISCGSAGAGDLAKIDKSFYIDQATSTTNSFVASSVWNSSGRTLTDYSTSSIASAIWNSSIRTLSSFGTLAGDIWSSATRSLTDYGTTTLASAVWSSPARTLTSFGTLVSDIATAVWGSGSRTLTAFGSLAADVWNNTFASTRRLTDQTLTSGGQLATQSDINNATSSIITEVLANRTLINNLNNISAADVWAYGARTLTSAGGGAVDLTASSTLAIWNVAKSSLTSSGSIGKTIADNLDATISSRSTSTLTAADVWLSATRTLSDYATSSLASAVWSNGSRTLTNYGNNITAADVWNVLTSSLTTTGSVGAQVAGVSTSTLASAVWSSATRSLTDYGTTTLASAVWSSPARTLTSFGTLVSDIATAVWGSGSRTLTAFGSLAADVWNNTFASTRRLTDSTLTSGGNIATQSDINNATSTIVAEVLANRTLINNLNNISAADVWAYGTRTTTGGSATVDLTASSTLAIWNVAKSSLTSAGSIGKTLADNIDATISSRSTSTLTAADVWLSATRTLSDYATSSLASAVWSNGSRTLTNYGNNITAADVWNVLTSSLTTAGSVGAQVAGTNTSTIASSIWSSATRSLTDYGTTTLASAVWSSPARTLTSFGTLVSDIATAVWGSGSRTLTAFGSLAADVWNNTFASTRRLTDQTLTSGGQLATQSDINNATSSIITEVLANRTLINNLNNISAADVWAYGARTLTSAGGGAVDLTASSTLAIWNVAKSSLTSSGSIGKTIADNLDATISSRSTSTLTAADVWLSATRTLSDYATSSLASAVWSNGSRTLTNYGNNITAADVWNVLTSSLTTTGSVGAQVAGVSTSTLASAVWSSATRSLTDYGTTTLASAVWSSPARTLTSFGTLVSDIATAVWGSGSRTLTAFGSLAADVWNNTFASTRRLTDQTLTGGGSLATQSDINNATSSIITEVLANRTLINNLNNISASDVWAYGARTLTSAGGGAVDLTASSTLAIWNVAKSSLTSSGSIGKTLADNIDVAISSRGTSTSTLTAADVWLSATRTLSDYATSSLASAVWSNGSRTLTNYGNNITAADVWNVLTSSLTTTGSVGAQVAGLSTTTVASSVWNNGSRIITGQQGAWITTLSDTDSVMTGRSYRAKYYIYNSNSATDPYAAPQITLYDADRNVVVSGVAMTRLSTGVYEYVYSVASGATQGAWETIVSTQVESGRFSENTDYWEVRGAPAQVIIREVSQTQVPDISANVTITNEGTSGYEYTYEWCVVSQSNNSCGGGNDVFYGSAAKFILPGENWDTALTATVPTAGNYYFKLVVYFGAESSGASRSFTATSATVVTPPSGGGGGGGGGNTSPPPVNNPPAKNDKYPTADSNKDGKVDAVDFSIMLFYWKTKPPYGNIRVDINKDRKVDAVDFSIMLFQWTGKK